MGYIQPMRWPESLEGLSIHLAGAKGTGMSALAELLVFSGARVVGSDIDEEFYTDAILAEIGVVVRPFRAESLDADTTMLVRSAAYDATNPVVSEATRRNLPILSYPEVLGILSQRYDSSAIAGVHGKTTTTAIAGTLLKALKLPATVLVGSAVSSFNNRSTWNGGERFFVAETCEYRRHFLHFHPQRIVLTSIESDHQDYYPDLDSIMNSFRDFLLTLPPGGEVIYCADDSGAVRAVELMSRERSDIVLTPYGRKADGPWKVVFGSPSAGKNRFRLRAIDADFHLTLPGRHLVLDAVAALALTASLIEEMKNDSKESGNDMDAELAVATLAGFRGSRRRSEIIGNAKGVLVMDDYAHHPTSISAMLQGIREFHPDRRLVVDFMPHTYSRTASLFQEFTHCFVDAEALLLHPIYASAREINHNNISGRRLFEHIRKRRLSKLTLYCETLNDAAATLMNILRPGDLFLTLGAGNNRSLGIRMLRELAA